MPALTMFEVTPDHPVPISPQGGTASVTVLSGDTLYYADTPQVSAANNQGSVTAGNVQTFTNPAWVRSASLSTVLAQIAAPPAAALLGSDGSVGGPGGTPLTGAAVTARPSGGAAATTPGVLLDTYYDASIYASKTAAIQAAYAAAVATHAELDCTARRVYSLDAGPLQLSPNTPIRVNGRKCTFRANWAKPRIVDFVRNADYDTFTDVIFDDVIFDANNIVPPSGAGQTVVGNLIDGGWGQRVNATRIRFRRCQWVNTYTSTTGAIASVINFGLCSAHLASGEAQTNLTDIRLEDAKMTGGNSGAFVAGTSPTGGVTNVEVYHDKIYLDVDHDTTVVPSAAGLPPGAHVQVASLGWGDGCEVKLQGANSADVGVEIDGMQYAKVTGTVADSRNAMFFCRNFHAAAHASIQLTLFDNCHAKIVNLNPDGVNYASTGFMASYPAAAQYGEAVLASCTFDSRSTVLASHAQAISLPGRLYQLTIRGGFRANQDNVNYTLTSTTAPVMYAFNPAGSCTIVGDDLHTTVTGPITLGGFTFTYKDAWVNPQPSADVTLDIARHHPNINLSGVAANSCFGAHFGPVSIPANVNVTGTTTNLSATVTGVSAADMANVQKGDPVSAAGIPANATVRSINVAAGSFTMSAAATASATVTIAVTPLACVRGRWRMVWGGDQQGDTAPYGCYVQKWLTAGRVAVAGAFMALDMRLDFSGSDFSRMPAGSAGNGNTLGLEVVDTGNAANAFPLVMYKGVQPANFQPKSATSTVVLANGTTNLVNSTGRTYQYWLSVVPTALTYVRGSDQTPNTVTPTAGPFYLEPGDRVAVTSAGGSAFSMPADF